MRGFASGPWTFLMERRTDLNLRKINRVVHRDLGYLCAGLTLVYALSGVLLNHIHHWNSNYRIERAEIQVEAGLLADALSEGGVGRILDRLDERRPFRAVFQPDPSTLRIFVDGGLVELDLKSGAGYHERVAERTIVKGMNDLHLNRAGSVWTWFADVYAGALALLAITGLFVLKGRSGITGRGAWLTSAGILLPLILATVYL